MYEKELYAVDLRHPQDCLLQSGGLCVYQATPTEEAECTPDAPAPEGCPLRERVIIIKRVGVT